MNSLPDLSVLAGVLAVVVILVALWLVLKFRKRASGKYASVRHYGAIVSMVRVPLKNVERDLRKAAHKTRSVGYADSPDYSELRRILDDAVYELNIVRDGNLLDPPGYRPPDRQNGERQDKSLHNDDDSDTTLV